MASAKTARTKKGTKGGDEAAANLARRRAEAWAQSDPGTPYGTTKPIRAVNGFDDVQYSEAMRKEAKR